MHAGHNKESTDMLNRSLGALIAIRMLTMYIFAQKGTTIKWCILLMGIFFYSVNKHGKDETNAHQNGGHHIQISVKALTCYPGEMCVRTPRHG